MIVEGCDCALCCISRRLERERGARFARVPDLGPDGDRLGGSDVSTPQEPACICGELWTPACPVHWIDVSLG